MKAPPVYLLGAFAMGLGLWLGATKSGPATSTAPSAAASGSPSAPSTSKESSPTLSGSASDERLARLLGTLQQTGALRKRYELFEALSDVSAADLPALIARAERLPPIHRRPLLAA